MGIKLVAESGSALCASASKYLTPVCACHSFSEAVLFASLALFGLICSKHVLFPFPSITLQFDIITQVIFTCQGYNFSYLRFNRLWVKFGKKQNRFSITVFLHLKSGFKRGFCTEKLFLFARLIFEV